MKYVCSVDAAKCLSRDNNDNVDLSLTMMDLMIHPMGKKDMVVAMSSSSPSWKS
jgi:hypothetical protein